MSDRVACLVCGEGSEVGPFVACAACASLHHQDCFEFSGRCAVYGCGSRDAGPVGAVHGAVLVLGEVRPRPGRRQDQAQEGLEVGRGQLDARPRVVSLSGSRVQFDRSGDLGAMIQAFQIFGVSLLAMLLYPMFLLLAIEEGQLGVPLWVPFVGWLVCGVVASCAHWLYQKCFVLDLEARSLIERKIRLGLPSERAVAGFGDVAAVAVQGRPGRRGAWAYGLVIVLKSGRILPLTDATSDDLDTQNENARILAEKLDVSDFPGEPRARLVVTKPMGKPPILEQRR